MTQPPDNLIVQDGRDPEGELVSLQKRFTAISRRFERQASWKKFVKGVKANSFAAIFTFVAAFAVFLLSPLVPMDRVKEAAAAAKAEWTPAPFVPNDLPARQASQWTQESDEPDTESRSTGVYYPNCAAARAAGAAPIHIGEPGYASWLDADGDGIACEPYRPRWR